jgi:hypothetical protein
MFVFGQGTQSEKKGPPRWVGPLAISCSGPDYRQPATKAFWKARKSKMSQTP